MSASGSYRRSSARALSLVLTERERQDRLVNAGRFRYTARDLARLDPGLALAVLAEEVGEVARVMCESGAGADIDALCEKIRPELVQVAAVALAWVEGTIER